MGKDCIKTEVMLKFLENWAKVDKANIHRQKFGYIEKKMPVIPRPNGLGQNNSQAEYKH